MHLYYDFLGPAVRFPQGTFIYIDKLWQSLDSLLMQIRDNVSTSLDRVVPLGPRNYKYCLLTCHLMWFVLWCYMILFLSFLQWNYKTLQVTLKWHLIIDCSIHVLALSFRPLFYFFTARIFTNDTSISTLHNRAIFCCIKY